MIPFYTYSGQEMDLQNVKPEQINMLDIAKHLSNSCRYNGGVKKFYSVAEHCVILSQHCRNVGYSKELQKACFLHDAAETYTGDITHHLKKRISQFCLLEDIILGTIFEKYGLDFTQEAFYPVKILDASIAITEMKNLKHKVDPTLYNISEDVKELLVKINCWTPEQAFAQFLGEAVTLGIISQEEHNAYISA